MHALQLFLRCFLLWSVNATAEQIPELLQETMTTIYTIGIPWLALFYWSQEHLIQSQCVCAIILDNHIGIYHVEHRLRHFLYCPTTDIFPVLHDKLRIFIFWSPCLESVNVQYIVGNDVYVNVDRRNVFVLTFQSIADKYWSI